MKLSEKQQNLCAKIDSILDKETPYVPYGIRGDIKHIFKAEKFGFNNWYLKNLVQNNLDRGLALKDMYYIIPMIIAKLTDKEYIGLIKNINYTLSKDYNRSAEWKEVLGDLSLGREEYMEDFCWRYEIDLNEYIIRDIIK